jgi:N-acetylglucosaminyl-diphospho-decaprenol L-rhamnosyltransferase
MPALVYYLAVVLGESARAVAGRQTSRASVAALLLPSRRIHTLAG